MYQSVIVLASEGDPVRANVAAFASRYGRGIVELTKPSAMLEIIPGCRVDLIVVSDVAGSGWNEIDVVRQVRAVHQQLPVILVVARSSEELAIAALKLGVDDYFRHPVQPDELSASMRRLLGNEPTADVSLPSLGVPGIDDTDRMIAGSAAMRRLRAFIGRAAASDSNVLITGETGTGKELVAGLIHGASRRRTHAFVAVNCAAIPETLIESELFGYERGAFTGAVARREGKLKLADHGTVFLDEIGDMSAIAQAKILRAIESREVHRLGGHLGVPVDIRFIAATNQDLESLTKEKKFRSDLYFRLNVARIRLPPLRERREDIPLFLAHYVGEFNRLFGRAVEGVTGETLQSLLNYSWPGNVRELKNVLESSFVNGALTRISLDDLPDEFRCRFADESETLGERERLLVALLSTNWNKSKAAEKLAWSRMTLYRRMAKYRLVRGDAPFVRHTRPENRALD